ncbi:MAG: transcriptional repressor [Campylobacterota bacterium]|nr:transcriptional repressor [Campylobacterota bacterium]
MDAQELLSNKKLKLTTARKELLEVFSSANRPLSYEDVKSTLNMDKATFYRNISKFEDEAIVNSLESNDKKRYYELQTKAHAHFICKLCNSINCINSVDHIPLDGYVIEDIIFKGVCKNCNT